MRIPEKAWADYVERLSRLNERAGQLMAQYIERHGTGDAAALADYAHALVVKYGEGNAELACQMYDAMAKAAGAAVPPAAPAEPAGYGEVARMVEAMRRSPPLLRGGVSRLVKRAGADTTLKNVQRDGAEFAWVPHGDTCPFCLMLASRGWRRAGKKTLQGGHARHIHANCDCEYAVRFDSNTNVAGYDPEKYLAQYNAANGDINAMRRAQYAQNKDKINAQKRAAYAERHPKKNQMVINGKTQGVPLNIRTALKANPNYANGREYKINCQRCVQAYEFRRRGYDVEALPKPSQNNIIKWGNECFVDSNGNTPQFAFYQTKKNIQTELQNAPDGARYIIYVQWKGRNRVAHVFIAEKSGSSIHYVDPQTADGDVSRYLDLGRDGRFGFLRIDDKRLTTDMQLINATVR
ncbi:MAG: hypothetical protein KH196_05290 [Oscillospiraceae bacterium]|nr:hypothetical protein [Oscillospiraceae bacterium]DAQ74932.1 MAG TPA: minor capsid protein 2 [Caudoviricetes sp.]